MDWVSILRNVRDTRTGAGVFVLTILTLFFGPFAVMGFFRGVAKLLSWITDLLLMVVKSVAGLPWGAILVTVVVVLLMTATVYLMVVVMVKLEQLFQQRAILRRAMNWQRVARQTGGGGKMIRATQTPVSRRNPPCLRVMQVRPGSRYLTP